MEVSGVNGYQQQQTDTLSALLPSAQNSGTETALEDINADIYEKGDGKAPTYKVDYKAVKDAINEANNQGERMRQLVEKLLGNQANAALKAGGFQWNKDFFEKIEVDEETRAQMEAEISEDGYWGVKQTSQRLLDFAKALSGGDPSKIDILRDAVQKGFDAAEKQWGDKLPDISYKTLEAVMKGFDEWAASAATDK